MHSDSVELLGITVVWCSKIFLIRLFLLLIVAFLVPCIYAVTEQRERWVVWILLVVFGRTDFPINENAAVEWDEVAVEGDTRKTFGLMDAEDGKTV